MARPADGPMIGNGAGAGNAARRRSRMEATVERLAGIAEPAAGLWRASLWGVDVSALAAALGIFAAFVLLRGWTARFAASRIERRAGRAGGARAAAAVAALDPPLRFAPVVAGLFLAKEILPLEGRALSVADDVVRSLASVAVFWALYRLAGAVREAAPGIAAALTDELAGWLVRGAKAALVLLGAVTVLEIWGIQVWPALAGLGLVGAAAALGARDLFTNLIAGVLILGERRFARGDWIRVEGVVEGTVEEIGLRSTRVRLFDQAPAFVPNARLADRALVNFSRMTHRRIFWVVGVEYRTTVAQLRRIRDGIEAFLAEDAAFAGPPEVPRFVRIDRFSDSSIDIMVYCFTRTTGWGAWLAEKERLAYRIKEIVEGAGAAFAFPSLTVYPAAEPFAPPETPAPPTRD